MKRFLAVLLSTTSAVALAGCLGASAYDVRMEKHIENLKFQQRLNQYLGTPATGRLQETAVFIRPPKPLAAAPASELPITAGAFDAAESFSGIQAGVPLRLHVLARLKNKPKAQPKPGEPAPPPEAPRGPFQADAQAVIDTYYGAATSGAKLDPVAERGRSFRRQKVQAGNGNTIDVYFFEEGNHQVALVYDIAPPAAATPSVEPGIKLSLGSFAVGPRAQALFAGGSDDDAAPAPPGGGQATGPGVSF